MDLYEHERAHDPFSPHVLVEEEVPAGPDPSGPGGGAPDGEDLTAVDEELVAVDEDLTAVDEEVIPPSPEPEPKPRRGRGRKRAPAKREDPALAADLAALGTPRSEDDDE